MGQILQTTGHRLVRSHERRADVPGFGIGERRIRFFDKPAPERPHLLAIVFDRVARLVPVRVGNYGEIFERNVGPKTPLRMERNSNALWTKGGLMYAMPVR